MRLLLLAAASCLGSATDFTVKLGELGNAEDALREERVQEGSMRRLTFGVQLVAMPDESNNTEPIAFTKLKLRARGSCKVATRDLTDGIKDIKSYSARIFDHNTVRFVDDGEDVPNTGEDRLGDKLIAYQGRDMINPLKTYEIGSGDWGYAGETWTGVAIEVGRNGDLCELCNVKATVISLDGRKKKSNFYVVRLGSRYCPDGAEYIV